LRKTEKTSPGQTRNKLLKAGNSPTTDRWKLPLQKII
jgi:hypothetical protein